jgi:hypothetical protein
MNAPLLQAIGFTEEMARVELQFLKGFKNG